MEVVVDVPGAMLTTTMAPSMKASVTRMRLHSTRTSTPDPRRAAPVARAEVVAAMVNDTPMANGVAIMSGNI